MENIQPIISSITTIDPAKLNNTELLNLLISITSLFIAVLSFAVAMIALIYTGYQFILKKGTKFYGIYVTSSSIWSQQRYVSEIILENKKDKASAINYIYLRIGSNIYLELVDYDNSPRIIAPFETVKIVLKEGVSGYISSTYKVNLDSLLADRKIRKTLLIATPQGTSKVKEYKKFWNIYIESLRNHFITPVRPVRKWYNSKEYSDALQYVVKEIIDGNSIEHYLYRGNSYSINGLPVNVDDFQKTTELEEYLKTSTGSITNTLSVEKIGYTFGDYDDYSQAEIFHSGVIGTHVIGKSYTKISSWLFRIKNKMQRKNISK